MQFAVKILRKSDLTLFEVHFRRLEQAAVSGTDKLSKQKAINLNADVFVDLIFPGVRGGSKRRFSLPLTIYGPGLRSTPHMLTRKVIAPGPNGKNWRLNGELIPNPDFDSTRYDQLQPGDVAVFGLEGGAEPAAISLVLVSQADPADLPTHGALVAEMGNKSMGLIDEGALSTIAQNAPQAHPLRELKDPDLDEALEEAAAGSAEAIVRLRSRGSIRRMTLEALQQAKAQAEAIGAGGETLLSDWFEQEERLGKIAGFDWLSDANSINPWDFDLHELDKSVTRIEAKTTRGPFDRPVHISHAELEFAADTSAPRTDLYRLYEFDGRTAKLAIFRDIRPFATQLLSIIANLRPGVTPDGYTVRVERFGTSWEQIGRIAMSDADAE